jgi:hypothetical protein
MLSLRPLQDLIGKDEIVGVCSIFDYGMVANGVHVRPFWANMYGATYPCNKPMYDTKEARRQCRSPSIATYYRGRLLISMEQDKNDGRKKRRQKVTFGNLPSAVSTNMSVDRSCSCSCFSLSGICEIA